MASRGTHGACKDLLAWLRRNLGRDCLAPLTGTDRRALMAAVHVIELYAYDGKEAALMAFNLIVTQMQPTTREFAFHSIAFVLDWPDRSRVWVRAGLPMLPAYRICRGER